MTSAEVYGRLLAAATIERGVEVCLRYFLPPYLGEVLAQAGHPRDALADPLDLARVSELTDTENGQVAFVVVATPGTIGDAVREPDGYRATWDVRAAVLLDLGDRLESREAAQFAAAAAGAALTHQGVAKVASDMRTWVRDADNELVTLEGSTVRWRGESYRKLERLGLSPTLIAGEAMITVTVEGARSVYGGPLEPPLDPDTGEPSRDPAESGTPTPVEPTLTIDPLPPTEDT